MRTAITYCHYTRTVVASHMDVGQHKSPFVFEDNELPVVMLFQAADKRPLEFDDAFTVAALDRFVREHGSTLKSAASEAPAAAKSEL